MPRKVKEAELPQDPCSNPVLGERGVRQYRVGRLPLAGCQVPTKLLNSSLSSQGSGTRASGLRQKQSEAPGLLVDEPLLGW